MSASIYFQSGQVVFDNNGRVAPGAKLYFYNANTTTPRDTFSDVDLTAERTHPVVADGNGRIPTIYLTYGSFDVKLTTTGGTQLFYQTDIANPAPFDDTTTFDTTTVLTTGDIFPGLANSTRTGAVRLNGRTIGNVTSSATERAADDTINLFAYIWNNCANAQAAVSTGRGASAAEDFAASKRITLPDYRGCSLLGFDDMGNTAASLLGSAPVVSGSTILPGSILGANTDTLSTANLPVITPTGTVSATTPAGTVQPSGSGAGSSYTPLGTVQPNGAGAGSAYTPLGTVQPSGGSAGSSYTPTGTVQPSGAGAGSSYTPTGGVSRPTITVTNGTSQVQATGNTLNLTASGAVGQTVSVTASLNSDPVFTGDAKAFTYTGDAKAFTYTGTGQVFTYTGTSQAFTFTGTAPSAPTFTGDAFGSGTAHNNLARSGLVSWFIKL